MTWAGQVGLALLAAGGALLVVEMAWLAVRLLRFRGRLLRSTGELRRQVAPLQAELERGRRLGLGLEASLDQIARQTRLVRLALAYLSWYRRNRRAAAE